MGQTNEKEPLEEKINGSPFLWGDALKQGSTGEIAPLTPTIHDNVMKQAHALTSIYYLLGGFKITSWVRTKEHNSKVGGSPNSMHLTGLATDFVPLNCTPEEARRKIKQAGIYPGRTELDATTWCHYDLKNGADFYGRSKK